MFQELCIDEPEPTGRTACADDEEPEKIGDIFSLVNILDLGIADRARTGHDLAHASADPADLFPRDLHGIGGDDNVPLVTKADDVPIDIFCDLFEVF